MFGAPGGVDPQELGELTRELEVSGYHTYLRQYVDQRIATLLVDDVTDPYVAMKRRGQVEELQRLVVPLFVKTLALAALTRRAEARTTAEAALPLSPGLERAWWRDPVDERPIP
jgi:hypothetical protein